MPMKKNSKTMGVVQRCEKELSGCISTVQYSSNASVQENSAVGRGGKALVMQAAPKAPTVRALNSNQGGTMSTRIDATSLSKQKHRTEIRIQQGSEPVRVIVYPYPVEVEIRPIRRAA